MQLPSSELWHKRMGHPSSRIVDLISEIGNVGRSDSVKNKFCDICFRAKQTKEEFISSDNKAAECLHYWNNDVATGTKHIMCWHFPMTKIKRPRWRDAIKPDQLRPRTRRAISVNKIKHLSERKGSHFYQDAKQENQFDGLRGIVSLASASRRPGTRSKIMEGMFHQKFSKKSFTLIWRNLCSFSGMANKSAIYWLIQGKISTW